MKRNSASQSAFFNLRVLISSVFCLIAVFMAVGGVGRSNQSGKPREIASGTKVPGPPDIVKMVGPVSQDKDLRALPYIPQEGEDEEVRLLRHPLPLASSGQKTDPYRPVRPSLPGPVAMPTPILTFPGINSGTSGCGCLPPDTHGDVGPNHYIQDVNSSLQIFSKAGATLSGPTTYNSFFSAMGPTTPCGNNQNRGDPYVMYDHLADRWVVSDFAFAAFPGSSFYQCIGVSKTSDPVAGGWWLYAIQIDPSNPTFLGDYPKFGLWPDAYYFSVNMFSNNTTFNGVRVFALDRAAMINGTGAPNPTAVAFTITPATLGDAYSLVPASFRTGQAPPVGRPEYFLAIDSPASSGVTLTQVHVWRFHVDFITPGNSTFGVGATHALDGNITVNGFVDAFTAAGGAIVPQTGTTALLDTLGDKIMTPVVYQNLSGVESFYAAHTVNNNQGGTGPTAIRWYQFNTTGNTIPANAVQQQTFNNGADGLWRWMPSIAVDASGNLAIGYTSSSATTNPAIRYAGRLAGDPINTLGQGEALLIQGAGHQTSSSGRWGDYSYLSIDPSDNLTFWHTNEYYSATSNSSWNTHIGSFRMTPQVSIANGGSTIVSAGPNNLLDPGETVTVSLGVINNGSPGLCTTAALTGTLQATGNVTNPTPVSQNYGVICPGDPAVFRNFIFKVNPALACGGIVTASLVMTDGATNYGTLTYTFATGTATISSSQNFDGVVAPALPAGWTTTHTGVELDWVTSTTNPSSAPNAAFAPDPTNIGNTELVTPSIAIPANGAQLSFKNLFNMEVGGEFYDGMVLEISINGGAFTDIITAGGSFAAGGYVGSISSSFASPIAGRMAWSGLSGGTTAAPTYITTTVNLPASANGQPVRLKWRAATDNSAAAAGQAGVRVDSITITTAACAPAAQTAKSRKTHTGIINPFSVDLPLAGNVGVECRDGGNTRDFELVVTFATTTLSVTGSPQAQVISGAGTVGTGGVSNGGAVTVTVVGGSSEVSVPLTNVANAQVLTVRLNNVNDGTNVGSVTVSMGMLLGDVNGDTYATHVVNSSDVSQVQFESGNPVTGANFRSDITASGDINSSDVSAAQTQSGTGF